MSAESQTGPSRGLLLLMAVSCGLAGANIYFGQPLANDFGVGVAAIAPILTATEIGFAVGLAFVGPLGEAQSLAPSSLRRPAVCSAFWGRLSTIQRSTSANCWLTSCRRIGKCGR
jgi:hypothetical protein